MAIAAAGLIGMPSRISVGNPSQSIRTTHVRCDGFETPRLIDDSDTRLTLAICGL
jgi:hypothetical protein